MINFRRTRTREALAQSANVPDRFIDLDRRFRETKPAKNLEDAATESYTFHLFDEGMSWDEILTRSRVVVLGEPGSGKTWEFRNRAKILRDKGQFAFFVRLDELAIQGLETLLAEHSKNLKRWKRSRDEGFFFLDSVDEAKFHKLSDYYAALDRFRNEIGLVALRRAKILLSSRISEWLPQTDAVELAQRFPIPPAPKTPTSAEQPATNAPLVVQFDPLDPKRV